VRSSRSGAMTAAHARLATTSRARDAGTAAGGRPIRTAAFALGTAGTVFVLTRREPVASH